MPDSSVLSSVRIAKGFVVFPALFLSVSLPYLVAQSVQQILYLVLPPAARVPRLDLRLSASRHAPEVSMILSDNDISISAGRGRSQTESQSRSAIALWQLVRFQTVKGHHKTPARWDRLSGKSVFGSVGLAPRRTPVVPPT
jgi:hypothetical protein